MTEQPQYDWQREDHRAFDIGETLARGFRLIMDRLADSAKLGLALVFGPGIIFNASQYLLTTDPDGLTLALILFGFVMFVVGSVIFYITLIILYVRNLWGEHVEVADAVRSGLPRFWPYIGVSILGGLGVFAGLLLLIVPGIILLCGWYVIAPVIVGERTGVSDALGRSWQLTSGFKWQIFAVLLVGLMLVLVTGGLLGGIVGAFVGLEAITKLPEAKLMDVLIFSAAESVSGVIGTIVGTAFVASAYQELLYVKREIEIS
jgi:hypothetical protein